MRLPLISRRLTVVTHSPPLPSRLSKGESEGEERERKRERQMERETGRENKRTFSVKARSVSRKSTGQLVVDNLMGVREVD
jgi:hypothetical protein